MIKVLTTYYQYFQRLVIDEIYRIQGEGKEIKQSSSEQWGYSRLCDESKSKQVEREDEQKEESIRTRALRVFNK